MPIERIPNPGEPYEAEMDRMLIEPEEPNADELIDNLPQNVVEYRWEAPRLLNDFDIGYDPFPPEPPKNKPKSLRNSDIVIGDRYIVTGNAGMVPVRSIVEVVSIIGESFDSIGVKVISPSWNYGHNLQGCLEGEYRNTGYYVCAQSLSLIEAKKDKMKEYKPLTPVKIAGSRLGMILEENASTCVVLTKTDDEGRAGYKASSIRKQRLEYCEAALPLFCKALVKDAEESSKIFGFPNVKAKLVGTKVPLVKLVKDWECSRDGVKRDYVILPTEKGNKKFVLSDCELIYPDPRAFKVKLSRSVVKGSKVVVINDKHSLVPKRTKLEVVDVISRHIGHSMKKCVGVKHLDLIKAKDSSGKVYKILAKNLKVYENPKEII